MRKVWGWMLLLLSATAAPVQAASLSGTYVGTGPDIAVLLQLVDSGGQLTGRYEQVKLSSSEPTLNRLDAGIKGNVDGDTIVFEMKPTELLSSNSIISGTVASNVLRLTGGGNGATFNLNLVRSSEDAFNSQVATLANQVSQIGATRTLTTDVKALEAISQRMVAFGVRAESELKKIKPFEDRFQLQTNAMQSALTQQRTLMQGGDSVAIRSQINGAIYRAGGESFQLHAALQSAHAEFESKSIAILNDTNALLKKCQSPISIATNSDLLSTWKSRCEQLPPVATNFRNRATQMLTSFAHAEAVWQDEDRKQQTIMKLS
ncbi:MAG TPA: hypothetical protein VGF44_01345, partial [Terriglobales bacterium]